MVHASLSATSTMYALFEKLHRNNYPIPEALLPNGVFITARNFDDLYFRYEVKRALWDTIFDIRKLDAGAYANPPTSKLAFGMKTDGHMISILFQKVVVDFVPHAKKYLMTQSRNIDFTNRTKGLYPLYKEPTGITANDRIIGIDPGIIFSEYLADTIQSNYFMCRST